MASTAAGTALTEAHRQQQVAIRAGFLAEFVPTLSLLDWRRIDETSPGWVQLVLTIIRSWRRESANVAESYYDRYRQIEVPRVSTPVPPVEHVVAPEVRGHREPDQRQADFGSENLSRADEKLVKPRIDWSEWDKAAERSLLVTGPSELKRQVGRGESEYRARRTVLVTSSGAASRHALIGGRETILAKADADKVLKGYIRVTDSDPCAFCAMLASRGPVFKDNSFDTSDPRWLGFGEVKVHDHCACTIEPVYHSDAAWPGLGRYYQKLWEDNIAKKFGGKAALTEWRRLLRELSKDADRRAAATG